MELVQECPVCGVNIQGDRVFFSIGESRPTVVGTKARLYARVCTHIINNPDKACRCLNRDFDGEIKACDRYGKPRLTINHEEMGRAILRDWQNG